MKTAVKTRGNGWSSSGSALESFRPRAVAVVPTEHLPGSIGKVAVLEERVRLNQALWHPDDAVFGEEVSPSLGVFVRAKR